MKKDNRGFTLVELIIAVTIILIVSLGFFGWASTIIRTNLSIERNNRAYEMAMDVADRLQRMYDNSLIQPGAAKYVGYDDGTDKDFDGKTLELNGCSGSPSTPSLNLDPASMPGMTIYTNPWQSTTPQALYLYDKNNCSDGKTWVDTDCGGTSTSTITTAGKITVTTSANTSIDHPNPNNLVSDYNSINPIRSYKNTTYYAVWSVAYWPCGTASTDRRKIFVTVYWIDPEPTTDDVAVVVSDIKNNRAAIKSVSVVVDKTIGTES